MLEILKVKRFPKNLFIVFSRASEEANNVVIHGSFDEYEKAKELFDKLSEKLTYRVVEDIPVGQYAGRAA